MAGAIIIARDGAEAEIIGKNPLAKGYKILSLSPGAAAWFKDSGFDVIDTMKIYSDCSHARSIINQQNAQSEFKRLALKLNLSDTQIQAVSSTLFYMSGLTSFYYQALRGFDRFYILNGKHLEEINGFKNAFEIIVTRILQKRYAGRDHKFSRIHLWLMKAYNARVELMLEGKLKILIIDGARPSSKSFARAAVKLDPNIAILAGRNPVKSMFVSLRHMWRSLRSLKKQDYFSRRVPMYFFYPAPVREYINEAQQIAEQAQGQFSKTLFKIAAPYIAKILKLSAGYEAGTKKQVEDLKPEIVTSDSLASGYTISVAKYAKAMGAKILMFNHASHTPQQTATSGAISNLWASLNRISSPHATYIAARSPLVAKLSRELAPAGDIIGVRCDEKLPVKPHKKFKLLFAGNYLAVENHVPWMLETPDEFIKGIVELVEAVAQVPEGELTIRVKPGKKDFNEQIMKKFIADYPNVIISNSGTMKEALERCDMVVASISTTIEEALQSGRSVLLHSGPKRYQHLPKGGAVYASNKNEKLVDLLRKIVADKDKNKGFTPYIWGDNELDMRGLAKRILEI